MDHKNEISYYRLIFPQYRNAVRELLGDDTFVSNIAAEPEVAILREAGVLDKWFAPCYKKQVPANPEPLEKNTWYQYRGGGFPLMYHMKNNKCVGWSDPGIWTEAEFRRPGQYEKVDPKFQEYKTNIGVGQKLLEEAQRREYEQGTYLRLDSGEIVRMESNPILMPSGLNICAMVSGLDDDQDEPTVGVDLFNKVTGKWIEQIPVRDMTWYWNPRHKALIFHVENGKGYGIKNDGEWVTQQDMTEGGVTTTLLTQPEDWDELSDNEVHDHLKQFAIKQGYIKQDDYATHWDKDNNILKIWATKRNSDRTLEWITILDTDEWSPVKKVTLPVINGYQGEYQPDKDEIVYNNCAVLRPEWFLQSATREIAEMTLSSGVTLNHGQMQQIREFLLSQDLCLKKIKEAQDYGMRVYLDKKM